jgi:hypothetical protein
MHDHVKDHGVERREKKVGAVSKDTTHKFHALP